MATTTPTIEETNERRKLEQRLLDEIAQLKWRAARLNQRSRLLQLALDATDEGFAVFDVNFRLVAWNQRFLDLVGLPQETAEAGLSALDLVRHYARRGYYGPVDAEVHARKVMAALRGAHPPERSGITLPDGRHIEIRRFWLADSGFVSVYADITHQRQTEAAIADSEERLRHFSEAASDWFWEIDEKLRFTYVSHRFEEIGGITREEIYGQKLDEVYRERVPADDRTDMEKWQQFDTAVQRRAPFRDFTFRWVGAGQEVKLFRTSGVPVFDARGGFTGYRGVGTDVTDKWRVEQALAEQTGRLERVEALLQDAIQSMPDGFLLWGPDDRLVLANDAFRRSEPPDAPPVTLGVRFADIMEARVRKGVVRGARMDPEGYIQDRLAAHRRAQGDIIEQQLADGRWIEIREYRTRFGGVVCFRRDISERKQVEAELASHRENLEELVEARSRELEATQRELLRTERLAAIGQLTGTVSHELRNPLGTIRSSFSVVRSTLPAQHGPAARAIERIERNIDRCVAIIDELLAYTRVRDLNLKPVAFDRWLKDQIREEAIPEGISLELDFGAGVDVLIDAERLRQAVLNLLINAWQALEERGDEDDARGHIRVATRVRDGRLELCIEDDGPGIPEGIRERIFDPLFSTKSFGVGLGLPLVKQIVEQHEGEIRVSSVPEEGTRVTVVLPLAEKTGRPPTRPD
ncbi:MAG: PAS-domain containing protein [Gammaproteobacteria bacterium]|nr:PAS-domain containing protein [Gammaproteobacteria bacterium]